MVFYITAAVIYPFYFNPGKLFFCDLMQSRVGTQEDSNPSLPFAILALFSISVVITVFFIWFSSHADWSKNKKIFTNISGGVSAFLTAFVFTKYHDEFILAASIIGFIPVSFVALDIIKDRSKKAPILGLISLVFLGFYNVSFYLNILPFSWPLMQKSSIILCLLWINILPFKKQKTSQSY